MDTAQEIEVWLNSTNTLLTNVKCVGEDCSYCLIVWFWFRFFGGRISTECPMFLSGNSQNEASRQGVMRCCSAMCTSNARNEVTHIPLFAYYLRLAMNSDRGSYGCCAIRKRTRKTAAEKCKTRTEIETVCCVFPFFFFVFS